MSALLTAILAGLIAALAPVLLIRANGRERRKDQLATWERDDKVAAQAREAAALLLAAQEATIARTDAVAAHVANATAKTEAKLNVIHGLVDGQLTDAKERALAATLALLPYLEQVVTRARAAGGEPSAATLRHLDETRQAIVDLRATLETREREQARLDAEAGQAEQAQSSG